MIQHQKELVIYFELEKNKKKYRNYIIFIYLQLIDSFA